MNRQSHPELNVAHRTDQVLRVFIKPVIPILIAALALSAASCKVGSNYTTPAAKVAVHWQETPVITNRAYSAAEEYWWRYFSDPVLDELIENAFSSFPNYLNHRTREPT